MWLIISDTHDNLEKAKKAAQIAKERGVKTIFHCGDIVAPFVVPIFKEFKLYMVYGNNDGEWLYLKEKAGDSIAKGPRELEVDGFKVAMMHEPFLLEAIAKSGMYDFVFYGHTHEIDIRKIGETLIINPGEACGCLTGRATAVLLNPQTGKSEVVDL